MASGAHDDFGAVPIPPEASPGGSASHASVPPSIDLTNLGVESPYVPRVVSGPRVDINPRILSAATTMGYIASASFIGLIVLVAIQVSYSAIYGRSTWLYLGSQATGGSATHLPQSPTIEFIIVANYFPHILLFFVSTISSFVAYWLVVASGADTKRVIPDQDYEVLAPLISKGNTEGIDLYVRLSSLTGFTGTFTKLGLTGLPLATIALTLFFSVMSFQSSQFMDLAKLTLGAFIGSFVQRQVERRAQTADSNQSTPKTSGSERGDS